MSMSVKIRLGEDLIGAAELNASATLLVTEEILKKVSGLQSVKGEVLPKT